MAGAGDAGTADAGSADDTSSQQLNEAGSSSSSSNTQAGCYQQANPSSMQVSCCHDGRALVGMCMHACMRHTMHLAGRNLIACSMYAQRTPCTHAAATVYHAVVTQPSTWHLSILHGFRPLPAARM